jgi:cytochrome c-type biogenesis protein CcmE
MNATRKKRLNLIILMLLGVGTAVGLGLLAFQENIQLFFTPTQVMAGEAPVDRTIRIGGLVLDGSVQRSEQNLDIKFDVTDTDKTVPVLYTGILPDLFREGQGIVAIGKMDDKGTFIASEVLAKHDENYQPPEVMEALKTAAEAKARSKRAAEAAAAANAAVKLEQELKENANANVITDEITSENTNNTHLPTESTPQ